MIEPFTPKQSMQILHTVFGPFFYDKSRENLFNSQELLQLLTNSLHSHDPNVIFRGETIPGNYMLLTCWG